MSIAGFRVLLRGATGSANCTVYNRPPKPVMYFGLAEPGTDPPINLVTEMTGYFDTISVDPPVAMETAPDLGIFETNSQWVARWSDSLAGYVQLQYEPNTTELIPLSGYATNSLVMQEALQDVQNILDPMVDGASIKTVATEGPDTAFTAPDVWYVEIDMQTWDPVTQFWAGSADTAYFGWICGVYKDAAGLLYMGNRQEIVFAQQRFFIPRN
jgi:hypothetical protein